MPERNMVRIPARIVAQCKTSRSSFALAISELSTDGCSAEAPAEWAEDLDFLQLTIADRVAVNGRIQWHEGRHAGIRFFGQIHPAVVKQLAAVKA